MEGSSSKIFMASLFMLLAISSCINPSFAASANQLSTEFIRTSCRSTTYPRLCFSSLSVHANSIQTSPQLLASTALNVTLFSAQSTSTAMARISRTKGMSPKVVSAMKDCVEELIDSVDELRKSMGEMNNFKGGFNFLLMINDIQTWVSAALTDESTCSDGFAGNAMNGNVKTLVRGRIVNVAQLTSNALALINQYAALHG
ncbi:21 kDa protein-like [Juglans microcarpa x Juglans regia]|uniref:21 kDa protein-like n=1 Tax=Juglans microcarpa x Juglans regia TaxID=2249226 RepID=UPI001B7F6FC6|nr:21 kDa protein-like [Juglans microcarpa x Juglans regia]